MLRSLKTLNQEKLFVALRANTIRLSAEVSAGITYVSRGPTLFGPTPALEVET